MNKKAKHTSDYVIYNTQGRKSKRYLCYPYRFIWHKGQGQRQKTEDRDVVLGAILGKVTVRWAGDDTPSSGNATHYEKADEIWFDGVNLKEVLPQSLFTTFNHDPTFEELRELAKKAYPYIKNNSSSTFSSNANKAITELKNQYLSEVRRLEEKTSKMSDGRDVLALVKRRVGQGAFRELLIATSDGKCAVSGLEEKSLLIASHIIPWSKATPSQKTDYENGILLSVIWDALFDKGLITFNPDNGQVKFSKEIDKPEILSKLGINRDAKLNSVILTNKRKEYLKTHNDKIFIDSAH